MCLKLHASYFYRSNNFVQIRFAILNLGYERIDALCFTTSYHAIRALGLIHERQSLSNPVIIGLLASRQTYR